MESKTMTLPKDARMPKTYNRMPKEYAWYNISKHDAGAAENE